MRYQSFVIENFKGIERAEINLQPNGASVYTLIGLNESGKTTILEAINVFGRENETKVLYQPDDAADDPTSYVPKHLKANFSGDISVIAVVTISQEEKQSMISLIEKDNTCVVDAESIPLQISIKRGFRFENSDLIDRIHTIFVGLRVKRKGKRKFVDTVNIDPEWKTFSRDLGLQVPTIVYFPSFLFSQPQRILLNPESLTEKETVVNKIYRRIIENVGLSLKSPLVVKTHIVERILADPSAAEKMFAFFLLAPDKQEQVNATLAQLSNHLTDTIFKSWSQIFGGDFSGREILLQISTDRIDDKAQLYISFSLRERTATYSIFERSLGFRWLFSFLLFTLYRVSAKDAKTTLFLLDEPASNLHSRAQMQLLESLPRIAKGDNQIIYSTHSHYLVNPDWLNQAFIVANDSVDYHDFGSTNPPRLLQATNVKAQPYRRFVGENPDRLTYFQPVLDKLDFAPSRLELI